MSTNSLIQQLLALPLPERVDLAEALWESIDGSAVVEATESLQDAVALASRRDSELNAGAVVGRSHEEVMEAARRNLGCE